MAAAEDIIAKMKLAIVDRCRDRIDAAANAARNRPEGEGAAKDEETSITSAMKHNRGL